MKKGLLLFLVMAIVILTGCRQVDKIEMSRVTAKVVGVEYQADDTDEDELVSLGKATTHPQFTTQSGQYEVSLSYEGKTYTLDNKAAYKFCKGKVGQMVVCQLKTTIFNDGTDLKDITKVIK